MARKFGDWGKALALLTVAGAVTRRAANKAMLQEAQFFRKKIVQGIRQQAPGGKKFKPLADTTLKTRKFQGFRGTKALVRKGDLRNSITVVERGSLIFVGILKSATNKDGKSLVNIGAVHEFGSKPIVIPVTAKMAGFLAGALGGAPPAGGVIIVRIPARPFIAPVFRKFGTTAQVQARMSARLRILLLGKGFAQ